MKTNKEYYDASGHKIRLIAEIPDGKYWAAPGYVDDDGPYYDYDNPQIYSRIFDKPPVQYVDSEIKNLEEIKTSLKKTIKDLRAETERLTRENLNAQKEKSEKNKKYEPANILRDLIGGKLKYFTDIPCNYGSSFKVSEITKPEDLTFKWEDGKTHIWYGNEIVELFETKKETIEYIKQSIKRHRDSGNFMYSLNVIKFCLENNIEISSDRARMAITEKIEREKHDIKTNKDSNENHENEIKKLESMIKQIEAQYNNRIGGGQK